MTGLRLGLPGRLRRALLPLAAAGAMAALDVLHRSRSWSTLVTAGLDEPAHLVTAWLMLLALVPRRALPGFLPWVLAGAVALDLDHLPLYLGFPHFLVDGGRPPAHSLATVAVLLGLTAWTRRYRLFGGLTVGVLLHLVRDLATGPGVPLGWPLSDVSVGVPYAVYASLVAAAALVAAAREAGLIDPPAPGTP